MEVLNPSDFGSILQKEPEGGNITYTFSEISQIEAGDDLKLMGRSTPEQALGCAPFYKRADDPKTGMVASECIVDHFVPS